MPDTTDKLIWQIVADDKFTRHMRSATRKTTTGLRRFAREGRQAARTVGAGFRGLTGIIGRVHRSVFNLRNLLLGGLAVGGLYKLTQGLKKATLAASDVEEMESKFAAVFKDQGPLAAKWADTYGKAVNRSVYSLKGMLAAMQDTFVPFGFARKEARRLSQDVVQLATDLASFNNKAEPDVLADLQSALVGNHETMRKYGVVINQTTLEQEALNKGIKGGVRNATEQQKVLLRLNQILEGTKDAQGDAARTAGSFANQLKGLTAAKEVMTVRIGKFLAEAIKEKNILGDLAKGHKNAAEWMDKHKNVIKTFVSKGVDVATKAVKGLVGKLKEWGESDTVQKWFENIGTHVDLLILDMKTLALNTEKTLQRINSLFDRFSTVGPSAKSLGREITAGVIKDFGKGMPEEYRKTLNKQLDAWVQEAQKELGEAATPWVQGEKRVARIDQELADIAEQQKKILDAFQAGRPTPAVTPFGKKVQQAQQADRLREGWGRVTGGWQRSGAPWLAGVREALGRVLDPFGVREGLRGAGQGLRGMLGGLKKADVWSLGRAISGIMPGPLPKEREMMRYPYRSRSGLMAGQRGERKADKLLGAITEQGPDYLSQRRMPREIQALYRLARGQLRRREIPVEQRTALNKELLALRGSFGRESGMEPSERAAARKATIERLTTLTRSPEMRMTKEWSEKTAQYTKQVGETISRMMQKQAEAISDLRDRVLLVERTAGTAIANPGGQ